MTNKCTCFICQLAQELKPEVKKDLTEEDIRRIIREELEKYPPNTIQEDNHPGGWPKPEGS